MANKVLFGLSNVHFALVTIGPDGTATFGEPHKQPGAVNLTLDPNGSVTPFYADNMIYYQAPANQGYTGTLEMALFDDWFHTNVLGDTKDSNGVMVENANANPQPFAMLYEVQGDKTAARRVLYYVTVERGSETAATKGETTEPQTTSMNVTVSPLPGSMNVKAYTTEDVDAETFNSWYTQVYMPTGTFTPVATLQSLTLGALTLNPVFASDTYSYTTTTTNATNTINAVATDESSTITIQANDAPVANGSAITWEEGSNTVTVTVSNEGASQVYTITVTKSS